jgi:hypothetical protein
VIVSNAAGQVTSSTGGLTVVGAFTNGSFESDYASWSRSGNQAVVSGEFWVPTDGVKLVAFNVADKAPNATLTQRFATEPGRTYILAFDLGAISTTNLNEQRVGVTVQGQSSTPLVSATASVFAPGNGTTYVTKSYTFVADTTVTTITFRDRSPTTASVDLLLDRIRITAQ